MGRSNASYLAAVLGAAGGSPASGDAALRSVRAVRAPEPAERGALRRYSTSEYAGQEDGATLNAILSSGSDGGGWAASLDGACRSWETTREVLVWRASDAPHAGPSPCFLSCTAVERKARQVRSRKRGFLLAVVLPAGFPLGLPAAVWEKGDDARTLGVVKREREFVLPRGTALETVAWVDGLGEPAGIGHRVRVVRAVAPAA